MYGGRLWSLWHPGQGESAALASGKQFVHVTCILALRQTFDAQGQVPGKTGVWVEDRKIGAVGVKISQGVASHGIAINISTNLTFYQNIVPCGIEDCEITTVEKEAGACVEVAEFGHLLVHQLQQRMKYDNVISIPPSELFAPGEMALA